MKWWCRHLWGFQRGTWLTWTNYQGRKRLHPRGLLVRKDPSAPRQQGVHINKCSDDVIWGRNCQFMLFSKYLPTTSQEPPSLLSSSEILGIRKHIQKDSKTLITEQNISKIKLCLWFRFFTLLNLMLGRAAERITKWGQLPGGIVSKTRSIWLENRIQQTSPPHSK